jgi:hypothetical protein
MKIILITAVLGFLLNTSRADDRIWYPADVKINGQPVRLILDTGSDRWVMLLSPAARLLGLQITNVYADSQAYEMTEPCYFTISNITYRDQIPVLDMPNAAYYSTSNRFDGFIGWPTISNDVFQIDAEARSMRFLDRVPEETSNWMKFPIVPSCNTLHLVMPRQGGGQAVIFVDTGADKGFELSPKMWQAWKADHPNAPLALHSYFIASGPAVAEEALTRELAFGPLIITNTLIKEATPADEILGFLRHDATFGVGALKRLDFIVDGKQGVAYLRPKKMPPTPYNYNRSGMVAAPRDMQSNDLIAHVADGSPAYEAGIRTGDILLKRDQIDYTNWRTDPAVWSAKRVDEYPAGTKFDYTLKRGTNIFKTTVVLRDYLSPQ